MSAVAETATLRPYMPGDVERLHLTASGVLALGGLPLTTLEGTVLTWQEAAVTFEVAGQVLACWGLVCPWPSLAEAWCVVDAQVAHHLFLFARTVQTWLLIQRRTLALRRVQCHVRSDHRAGLRLARFLGFTAEATLDGYGPDGASYALLALLQPEGGW